MSEEQIEEVQSRQSGTMNSPELPDEPVQFEEAPPKRIISSHSRRSLSMLLISVCAIIIIGGGILLVLPDGENENTNTSNAANALQESILRVLPERQPGTNAAVLNPPVNRSQTTTSNSSNVNTVTPASLKADTDNDGLLDRVELQYGTDITKPDSDGDTVNDILEIYVYGTDPNVSDTDGDGFHDGEEIKNGYNPKGEGRI